MYWNELELDVVGPYTTSNPFKSGGEKLETFCVLMVNCTLNLPPASTVDGAETLKTSPSAKALMANTINTNMCNNRFILFTLCL